MAFTKSHSNYVLKSKHQLINDGTIWERDITTIGAVDQFSPGQMPIYRSGNFIITVRSDSKMSSQHNTNKWEENDRYGTVWTMETVNDVVSPDERQDDTKIVLKQDYYDFRDFAYYGSLTELFRSSINDIISRFPGELYATDRNAYYTSGVTENFERIEESVLLGGENLNYVVNPFGINIHSLRKPDGADPFKYFAEEGYRSYIIFTGDTYDKDNEANYEITNWDVDAFNDKACKPGDFITKVTINGSYVIEVYVGEDYKPYYLSEQTDFHIRPKSRFLYDFYNGCSNFEYLLMNPNSTPLYKSTFSVIRENDYGYYRELISLEFPKDFGGYNIDVSDYGFNNYTNTLSEIGSFYDERFSDNLYRSMTHESIKNFDWSHTREYNETEGEEDDNVLVSGQKVQKALRVFAREFDEILPFIDNLKNTYTVTYDQRNNIPDYFLTDTVGSEGWDVKLVMPQLLKEYYYDGDQDILLDDEYYKEGGTYDGQLNNKAIVNGVSVDIVREFTQPSSNLIKPYSKEYVDFADGYFVICGESGETPCWYEGDGTQYSYIDSSGQSVYNDTGALSGKGVLKRRIKAFTDEREYTYLDANNEFLRRLKINSRNIWRHKGTLEGIEMILGMFGLRSKRWAEKISTCEKDGIPYDYEITEYTSFAERIEEKWDATHQMYRIEWINSTKDIVYDNRFISEYNPYGRYGETEPYQGIPVSFRDEYLCEGTDSYIKISPIEDDVIPTSDPIEAFKRIDQNNAPVRRRYLYPHFDKNKQHDGNPYFQMDGGWFSKMIAGDTFVYNFQFDVDDNIVFNNYVSAGTETEDGIIDNYPLYRETIRNIRRVDNVASLLQIPSQILDNNAICYVSSIEKDSVIIDDTVYEVKHEYVTDYTSEEQTGTVLSYISFIKSNGAIRVGYSKYFSDTIVVYDKDGIEVTYNVGNKPDGYELKAYIVDGRFVCKSDLDGLYSIEHFVMLNDNNPDNTNYFKLDKPYYSDTFAVYDEENKTWSNGWRRLKRTDYDYLKINTIINYFEGNNGHNGNMRYDSGHEYFTYFKRLFKYAVDNDKIDERCYEDYFDSLFNEIDQIGFSGLIEDNEEIIQYDRFLNPDNKIHFFGNYKTRNEETNNIEKIFIYGEDVCKLDEYKKLYSDEVNGNVVQYILNDPEKTIDGENNVYSKYNSENVDEVTDQIMNNKRIEVKFFIHNKWYSREGQEEIKYLDSVVMNYLEQMVPSTVIVNALYDQMNKECVPCDVIDIEKECDPCAELEVCSPCAELEISATCNPCDSISISADTGGGGDEPEPECEEGTTYTYGIGRINNTLGACDTSGDATIPYSATTISLEGGECKTTTATGNKPITVTGISENITDSAKTNEEFVFRKDGVVYTITYNQEAGPCTTPPPTPTENYFAITSRANNNEISLIAPHANSSVTISVSTDNGANWNTFESTTDGVVVATLNNNQTALFRGENRTMNRNTFSSTGDFDVSGDILTLTDGNIVRYGFSRLFSDSNIVSARDLVLSATTLPTGFYSAMFSGCTKLNSAPELQAIDFEDGSANQNSGCYQNMFRGCTNLTTAPELPATTLGAYCYRAMFFGCTRLTTAPELPATTLARACYCDMFGSCTNLTTAPELPVTELAQSCYLGMFYHCTNLTTAPELPATELAQGCYHSMFKNCNRLTILPELPARELVSNCYCEMFSDCMGLTTAPELPATTLASGCYAAMFSGCTNLTTAPELPVTELVDGTIYLNSGCYESMFRGCTSLTTAPELPATTLKSSCYSYMFYGCTALTSITCLATNITASECTDYWVKGVASTGTRTFYKAERMCDWSIGVDGIPEGWNVSPDDCGDEPEYDGPFTIKSLSDSNRIKITAPEGNELPLSYNKNNSGTWVPFTSTTDGYYIDLNNGDTLQLKGTGSTTSSNTITASGDFEVYGNITSLTNGQTNASGFMLLFDNSKKLISAKNLKLPAKTLAPDCYHYMFQRCSGLTSAPELPATTLAKQCYTSMFAYCKSLKTAPALNAMNLAEQCYLNMFNECTGLTTAPSILPATTLTSNCYQQMFYKCSGITSAPVLPATTLVSNCYNSMFQGCTSLKYIKALFTTEPNSTYTYNWVNGVPTTSDGVFVKNSAAQWNVRGVNGIPNNWNVEDA